jgi:hypothetical protein
MIMHPPAEESLPKLAQHMQQLMGLNRHALKVEGRGSRRLLTEIVGGCISRGFSKGRCGGKAMKPDPTTLGFCKQYPQKRDQLVSLQACGVEWMRRQRLHVLRYDQLHVRIESNQCK